MVKRRPISPETTSPVVEMSVYQEVLGGWAWAAAVMSLKGMETWEGEMRRGKNQGEEEEPRPCNRRQRNDPSP